MSNNENLHITYSAPTERERREIESIRREYAIEDNRTETTSQKVERLKKTHKKVVSMPTCFAISLGIVGTLLFGLGMAMSLEWDMFLWGSVVAAAGLIPVALSYPLYSFFYNRNKQKYQKIILELSDEILNGSEEA